MATIHEKRSCLNVGRRVGFEINIIQYLSYVTRWDYLVTIFIKARNKCVGSIGKYSST